MPISLSPFLPFALAPPIETEHAVVCWFLFCILEVSEEQSNIVNVYTINKFGKSIAPSNIHVYSEHEQTEQMFRKFVCVHNATH